MNDILGIIIPMLMSGADIMDIVKALGAQGSAAGMDGLEGMISAQMKNAKKAYPHRPDDKTMVAASENFLDRLDINPYTRMGQTASSFVRMMHSVAPDIVGNMIGLPNGGQFFGTLANGASGISAAAGYGQPDIFNPYSVMASQERARDLGRKFYGWGVRQNKDGTVGGYNVSFSHGLNVGEMGKVTQRILSSEAAYRDEDGRRFDLSTGSDGNPINKEDAEKFNTNLRKLGSKFNEAVSMLAKMTGSVEEAMKVMDQMAGGNALGGTSSQASAIAERARSMATAMRVTSAIAGISPQQAYANMQGLQQALAASGSGMSQYAANASGYSGLMQNAAFTGTMAFTTWAAMNPGASPEQRAQALFAANGRATAYMSQNGAAFAAAVAANKNRFSPEELARIESAYRAGRPNDVTQLVRERIGESTYSAYLTDPNMQIAARHKVGPNDEILNRLDAAGIEGGMRQAETHGNRMLIGMAMQDLDEDLSETTGSSDGLGKRRRDAVEEKLRTLAEENGLTKAHAAGMSKEKLIEYLKEQPGMDNAKLERIVNDAELSAASDQIDELTMSEDEESSAKEKMSALLNSDSVKKIYGDDKRKAFEDRIKNGERLESVFKDMSSQMEYDDREAARKDIFGGKMSSENAEMLKGRIKPLQDSQRVDYSTNERLAALRNEVGRSEIANAGKVKGMVASEEFNKLDDKTALDKYAEKVSGLVKAGEIRLEGGGTDLEKTYEKASYNMVSDVIGGNLGNLKGEGLDKLKASISQKVLEGVKGGASFQHAFASAMEGLSDEDKKSIGEEGMKQVQQLAKNVTAEGTEANRKVSKETFFSNATSVIDSQDKGERTKALGDMEKLFRGEMGELTDKDATKELQELSKKVGAFGGSGEDYDKMRQSAVGEYLKELGLSGEEAEKMQADVVGKFEGNGGGDYKKAILESIGERIENAKTPEEKKRLEGIAKSLEGTEGVGGKVLERIFGQMHPEGRRQEGVEGGFAAIAQAGSADMAALFMASSATGLDMSQLVMGQYAGSLVSGADDAVANAQQNRISNAFNIGDNTFARNAIDKTKKNISELGKTLEAGGVSAETVRKAFGGDDKESKEAMKKVEAALGKGVSEKEKGKRMDLLKSVGEAKKIGGQDAIDVMMGGEEAFKKIKNAGEGDADVLNITRETAKRGSDSAKTLDTLGEFTKKFSDFLSDPAGALGGNAIPVAVKESVGVEMKDKVGE